MPTMDHIGGKFISIRRTDIGVTITTLDDGRSLELTGEEWIELDALMVAIRAHAEYKERH